MEPQQSHLSHPRYRPDVDGLRAVAVLSVVAFHAFPNWLKGGFAGVDVFFVISGFLISSIIIENMDAGTFSFAEFYARRIRRIFPALILILVASYVFGWFALFADEYKQLGSHVAGGAGFVSNFVLWSEAGYFDNSAESKPLLHLWSLGVEEQFYIIWPLLLWLAWRQKFNLLAVTTLIAIASFYLNVRSTEDGSLGAFYSPQTRFWELMSGALIACIASRRTNFANAGTSLDRWLAGALYNGPREADVRTFANVLSFAGLFLLVYGFWRLNKDLAFPGKWALIPVSGSVLIICAGPGAWVNRTILSNRAAVWFGLISYPLYLWHWPLLSFAQIIGGGLPRIGTRVVLIVLSIVLSWLTYRHLERHFRRPGYTQIKVCALVVSMISVGCIGYATYSGDGFKFRSNIEEANAVNSELVGWNWKFINNNKCMKRYPLKGTEAYSVWFCMASSNANPTLLLLGDSHANHLYPGFVNNPAFTHQSVLSIGNCDAGWVEKSELSPVVTSYTCSGYRSLDQMELINGIVSRLHSVRYVIIAGGGLEQKPNGVYIARLRRRIDFLEAHGAKVILFAPHVWLTYNPRACFGRPFARTRKSCEVSIGLYRKKMRDFSPIAQAIKQSNPSVRIFDPNVLFCNDVKCSFKKDGLPLLRDEYGHLSEYGSNQLISLFAKWARTNVPGILDHEPEPTGGT